MSISVNRKLLGLACVAAAGTSLAGGATVLAANGGGSPQTGAAAKLAVKRVDLPAGVRTARCYGGVLKRSAAMKSNQFQIISNTTLQDLSTTPLIVVGPARGVDTVFLTFSAETQLRGNTANDQFDWVEGAITVDGVPVTDIGPDQLALTGSSTYSSNAYQACVRIGPGVHRINAQAAVVDNGSKTGESAWIDDFVLKADVHE